MNDEPTDNKPVEDPQAGWDRFQRLARALFRVEKKDVPKHEPKKRVPTARS